MVLGKKQLEQLSGFGPTVLAYGLGTLVTMLYLTEWKAVCKYIPFFNGAEKFQEEPKK